MLSDEEVIRRVAEMWEQHKHPTRNMMRKQIGCSEKRFKDLSKAGLIKFPPKVPKGMCHLFSNQNKWRAFKLKGSPKGVES